MRAVTRAFTTGGFEVEIVTDLGQPIARLQVEPKAPMPDSDLECFNVRYLLRDGDDLDETVMIGARKADVTRVRRVAP